MNSLHGLGRKEINRARYLECNYWTCCYWSWVPWPRLVWQKSTSIWCPLGENVATTLRYRCGASMIPPSYGFDSNVVNTHPAGADSVYKSGFFHQDDTF